MKLYISFQKIKNIIKERKLAINLTLKSKKYFERMTHLAMENFKILNVILNLKFHIIINALNNISKMSLLQIKILFVNKQKN